MNLFSICVKIFFARILDVSIGTFRTMIMIKGSKFLATILAFIEVMIWFVVAREALVIEIDSLLIPISYSLGYAFGTLIGQSLANRFIKGVIGIQIVAHKYGKKILNALRKENYLVSVVKMEDDIKGSPKMMMVLQINKPSLKEVERIVYENDPDAFVVISETKKVANGVIK